MFFSCFLVRNIDTKTVGTEPQYTFPVWKCMIRCQIHISNMICESLWNLFSIAASIISLRFFWSSRLPACWYIFLMFFIHLCSKEDLVNDDWSILIFFIWSSRLDDCNIHFITTHFCSNVLIDRMEFVDLFNTLDLTHWAAWGDLLSTWKHKYYLPSGGKCVVFGNATGRRGKVVIIGVKKGGVDVAWKLIFYFQGVTQEWVSSVFEMSTVF